MERDHLMRLLGRDGDVFAACQSAVAAGARFWVEDHGQPASTLVRTYARRERHTREYGIATTGFVEAVAALRASGEELVRIGAVDADDPPYHYQLFVNEDGTELIACLGVDQSHKFRDE